MLLNKPAVAHPFLVGLAPVCFLLAYNVDEVQLADALRPAGLVLCLVLVLLLAARLIARDWQKAGLLVSIGLILFFSYGHVAALFDGWTVAGVVVGRHLTYLCVEAAVFGAITILVLRTRRSLRGVTRFLAIGAGCFVTISLVQIGFFELAQRSWHYRKAAPGDLLAQSPGQANGASRPTIYYIIVDGYGRQDALKEFFGYDNSAFLDYLRQKGFYVAARSRANYCQTYLSLASSLNAMHLHELTGPLGEESRDRGPVLRSIQTSRVVHALRQCGYRFVTFASGYCPTEIRGANLFLEPGWALTGFETTLINTTPVPVFLAALSRGRAEIGGYESHRERILFAFDRLAEGSKLRGPVFFFAHIIAPHAPFVFDEDGSPVTPGKAYSLSLTLKERRTPATYNRPYTRQVTFVNVKLREMIDTILATSAEPPIIIIQADHGPGSKMRPDSLEETDVRERMPILNAYYFPDGDYALLHPDITPVNTFRVILNKYFSTGLELLPDLSYFSTRHRPYRFIDVTAEASSPGEQVPGE